MVEIEKEQLQKLSDEDFIKLLEYTRDYAEYSLSIKWFVLGIVVGLCGNIFSSFIIDLIKVYFPVVWLSVESLLGIGALIPLFFYSYHWFKALRRTSRGFRVLKSERLIEEVVRRGELASKNRES